MNPTLKEYRAVFGTAAVSLLCIGGSAALLWFSMQERIAAVELLSKRSSEINRFRNATPPPSKEHTKQLEKQLAETEAAYQKLRKAIIDTHKFPIRAVSPQDFQKTLNEKAQALWKRAEQESINLPVPEGESGTESFFYLSFKDYKSKPPSSEKAPLLNRQFQITEALLLLLMESHPISIHKVRLLEAEAPRPVPGAKGSAAAEAKKAKPTFEVQGFDLHFSIRPENLRSFLNSLASDKRAFFVARNLKIVNSKEKEPLKKADLGASAGGLNPAGGGQENAARYVLGEEFVEVELTLDMMNLAPETQNSSKDVSKDAKDVSKDAPKRP